MAWKLSLFGYQESEVNEYLQALSQSQGAEAAALREKLRLVLETNVRQDLILSDLRREAAERKNRLKAVESRLILIYYRVLLAGGLAAANEGADSAEMVAAPDEYLRQLEQREQIAADAGKRINALLKQIGRWEKEMDKTKNFNTSLLGVAPRDLEEYLILREKSHQEAIADLSEKLNQLEKAIALQGEEIKALEGLLERPEMQKTFIDLSERFLLRFERTLENVARETISQNRTALTDRERECERREKELRLQIARCRRKVNTLLRNLNQQQEKGRPLPPSAGTIGETGEPEETEAEAAAAVSATAAPAAASADVTTAAAPVAANAQQSLRFRYLLGKAAGSDLSDNQGGLLIKKGQIIGLQEAEAVYQQGLLDQLVRCLA